MYIDCRQLIFKKNNYIFFFREDVHVCKINTLISFTVNKAYTLFDTLLIGILLISEIELKINISLFLHYNSK